MTCNNINFSVELLETTETQAVIKVTADKYYECVTVKVALYNKDDGLLQDFSNEADLNNTISAIINVPITSEVCKIRVRVLQCCPDPECDPSTIVCDPGLVLDPGSCLCIQPPFCSENPYCPVTPCLWNGKIKGYVYYSHEFSSVNIPNIGSLGVPCFGGHICDTTVFMPKLQLGDGTIISANKTVSINNSEGIQSPTPVPGWIPQSTYDRSDIFEFDIEDTTDLANAKVFLDCAYNSCHTGVLVLALVGYCDELQSHKLMFFSCLSSGQIDAKPMFIVECNAGEGSFLPCDPPQPSPQPPQPTPSLSDFYCASVSTSEEDCAEKRPVDDPYIKPADQYINQPFNDVYIPRRVNLNITQNGCDVVARFCAISCRDGIPPSASPSPTPSVTPTSTPTPTPTPTSSNTPTPTPTPSITPSPCASPSVTPSNTPTRTPTRTPTPSPSVTRTPTPTPSTSTLLGCQFNYLPFVSLSDLPIWGPAQNINVRLDIDRLCIPTPYDLGTDDAYDVYLRSIGISSRLKPTFDSRYTLFQLFMEPRMWRANLAGKSLKLNIDGKSYRNASSFKIDGSPIGVDDYLFIGNFNSAIALRDFAATKINFGPGWPYNDLVWTPAIINKHWNFTPINVVHCIIIPC